MGLRRHFFIPAFQVARILWSVKFKMVKSYSSDLRWRVIFHKHIYGSTIQETAEALFVGKSFVKDIRRLYRQTKGVGRQVGKGRRRILTCKLGLELDRLEPSAA